MSEPMAKPRTVDFSRSAVSRYIQLTTLFRRRIESGQWAVGKQIPTVDDLSMECGVARATIRQALGILQDEGLIERFRAKGTFVIHRPNDGLWCDIATDWSELLAAPGSVIEMLSDSTGEMPVGLIHSIGELAPSYRHLHRRHWRQDSPYLVAHVFIDDELARRITPDMLQTSMAMRVVKDMIGQGMGDARQTLTIGSADVETAELLQTPINAPTAMVKRSVTDKSGRLVFVGEGIYRGDVVRVDVNLT